MTKGRAEKNTKKWTLGHFPNTLPLEKSGPPYVKQKPQSILYCLNPPTICHSMEMTPRAMVTYIYKDDWKIYLKNQPNKVDGGVHGNVGGK